LWRSAPIWTPFQFTSVPSGTLNDVVPSMTTVVCSFGTAFSTTLPAASRHSQLAGSARLPAAPPPPVQRAVMSTVPGVVQISIFAIS